MEYIFTVPSPSSTLVFIGLVTQEVEVGGRQVTTSHEVDITQLECVL
jgi:hypothetical protein